MTMMKKIRFFSLISVFILIPVLVLPVSAQEEPQGKQTAALGREARVDSVLASVNGEPITLLDLILESGNAEIRLASMYSGERLYSETEKFRRSMIEEIIVRKLVYEVYRAKPFKIEKQYVEDVLDSLAATMGDGSRESLLKKAGELGITLEDLREKAVEKLAVDAILSEFCDRMVYITPKEVYESYSKSPEKWTVPASVELQLLQILKQGGRGQGSGNTPETLCRLVSGLLKDQDKDPELFTRIVKEYSDAPNAENGGLTGSIDQSKLRPEFAEALKNLKQGQVVGPVETPEGFYFIRLLRETPAKSIPFEEVSPQIRAQLRSAAVAKRRSEYAERLKSKALIRYFFPQ